MSACLSAELRKALTAQVCCGIPELCEFLNCEIDFIWSMQDDCIFRVKYLNTQLALIEAAQIFSRNKIDTMTREASSQMQERYTAMSTFKSEAERDASGRSCSWAAATSSQFFNRDSEDQAIGWSDYRHQYTSNIDQSGYDKSCRHTFGYGFNKAKISARHDGLFIERGNSYAIRDSQVLGGTHPLVPLTNIVWDAPFSMTGDFPWIESAMPDDPLILIPPNSSDDVCPPNEIDNPDPNNNNIPFCGTIGNYPSAGSGLNGNFQFSFALPVIGGSISVSWNTGRNRRQYYHCTRSAVDANHSRTVGSTNTDTGSTDASENDNQTYSNENTTILHLVRKYGTLTRRSTTDNDAAEQAEGISTGIANSESERNAQSTAYAQSRSEAEANRHSESHFRRTERANNDMISAKYGQINKHLKSLWGRVWENLQMLEKQFAAIPYGGKLNCPKDNKSCLPVRRSYCELRATIKG